MAGRSGLSARWLTVILIVAAIASVAVVWGLIQVTGDSPAASSASSSAGSSGEPVPSGPDEAGPDESGTSAAPTELGPSESAGESGPAASGSAGDGAGSTGGATAPATTSTSRPPPPLPGSGLRVPAAWSGTAEVTLTVLGECAAVGGTSSYVLPADLAVQRPVAGRGPFPDANPISLTLGITPGGIPGFAANSAVVDAGGEVQRLWWLTTGAGPNGETMLSGVLIADQPVDGQLPPNLFTDNETDLQPCESGGTVGVPRTLAAGATLTGWISETAAELTLHGVSTDGERQIDARVTATRVP